MTAVITDVHYRMSLALIRDLALAGVRTVCCEREGVAAPLGFVSKYTDETALLPREGWPDALYDLCARLAQREEERPALLPVGAITLAALSAERERFGAVCGLCVPTPEQLDAFNSKEIAARLGESWASPSRRGTPPKRGSASPASLPALLCPVW